MMTAEELQATLNYGPTGSIMEARKLAESHLQLLNKVNHVRAMCRATREDASEVRWVRMFAGDVLGMLTEVSA